MEEKFKTRAALNWPEAFVISVVVMVAAKLGSRYLDIKEKQVDKHVPQRN